MSQNIRKSIFSEARPKTSEPTDLTEIDILHTVSFERLFENPKKNQGKIFGIPQQNPLKLLENKPIPPNPESKPEKKGLNLFKVFENKENFHKIPQKLDVSNAESRIYMENPDFSHENSVLKALNEKYEDKIDSLIAENSRISNNLSLIKKTEKTRDFQNIEAKLADLLSENEKLTQIIRNQDIKLKEALENSAKNEEIVRKLQEEKVKKTGNFQEIISDLQKELEISHQDNRILSEKIRNLQIFPKKNEIFAKNDRKIDTLHETFDTLAQLNEKLNVHLDAIQAKSTIKCGISEKMLDKLSGGEQVFQKTVKSPKNADF